MVLLDGVAVTLVGIRIVRFAASALFALDCSVLPPTNVILVEGDAGKEIVPTHQGAGGEFVVSLAGQDFISKVRQGSQLTESLGPVTLPAGNYEIRVSARNITGQELMRLRSVTLKPLPN